MTDLLIGLMIASMIALIATVGAVPWLLRERVRQSGYTVQQMLELARLESIRRNRDCALEYEPAIQSVRVMDTNNTTTSVDDLVLHERRLNPAVMLARPDGGSVLTFHERSSKPGTYHVIFDTQGIAYHGTGEVVFFGGDYYNKVTVYVGGGTQVDHWDGSSWQPGA
jgi:Tfp pilus assembly protein FimT